MVDTEHAPEVIISWPIIELQVHAGTKRKGLGDSLAKLSYQREDMSEFLVSCFE